MGHPSPPPSLATLRFGQASDGGSEGMAQPDPMIDFAELDAHNFPRNYAATIPQQKSAG
jgi:hypothetical protein